MGAALLSPKIKLTHYPRPYLLYFMKYAYVPAPSGVLDALPACCRIVFWARLRGDGRDGVDPVSDRAGNRRDSRPRSSSADGLGDRDRRRWAAPARAHRVAAAGGGARVAGRGAR